MAYLLEPVEALISGIRDTDRCLLKRDAKSQISFSEEIEHLHFTIKEKLLQKSAKQNSKKKLSNFIIFHQSNLIRLIDELANKKCSCQEKETCHAANLEPLIEKLTDTLIFINQQFKDFIDHQSTLPLVCELKHRAIIRESNQYLMGHLSLHGFSPEAISILLHPLVDFVNKKKKNYTFHDKYFLYDWLERLEAPFIPLSSDEEDSEFLCRLMISYNINSEECIQFFTSYFTEKYKLEETRADQLQMLKHFLKCIRQTDIIRASGYIKAKDPLHKKLIDWLVLEIDYIGSSCHISEKTQSCVANDVPLPQRYKVKLSISVSALAYFLKLLISSKIIITTNKEETFRFFAAHFSTICKDEVSPGGIKTSYSKPPQHAIKFIKRLLFEWLKTIQITLK
ncbi:hypothetical protein [Carboxylicivirga sp. M1479]|uniref:hypothetical protein n=1 Tax=Carboxylicivirga sp. M1479 TaxID=2594476 RepID=UPI0011778CBB|nr:hypothetical protein [Carboxylicivirga sp. M1479]TRX72554.1 hypothetical protein FNN09_01040 [Carboxylicivirga sp. M1479]